MIDDIIIKLRRKHVKKDGTEMSYFLYGQKETDYLRQRDRRLAEVIDKVGHIDRPCGDGLFQSVIHHIAPRKRRRYRTGCRSCWGM